MNDLFLSSERQLCVTSAGVDAVGMFHWWTAVAVTVLAMCDIVWSRVAHHARVRRVLAVQSQNKHVTIYMNTP